MKLSDDVGCLPVDQYPCWRVPIYSSEEGREGARTKGLQKSNPWYRGRLTTPRNHPHTLYRQWATSRM